jgi:putative ABC transport system permease protein
MHTLISEIRYSLRRLIAKPGFAVASILTLALGIGATTALFTVLDCVILRPLALKDPERLVVVRTLENQQPRTLSHGNFTDFRTFSKSYEQVEGYWNSRGTLIGQGEPEVLSTSLVTAGLFPMLGIQPAMGRGFREEEQKPNAGVAVISYELWQRKFGGAGDVLGKSLTLDGAAYNVIGVLGPSAGYPRGVAAWAPLVLGTGRFANQLTAIGRLRPGVTLTQAKSEAEGIGVQLLAYPENKARGLTVYSLTEVTVGYARDTIWILFGAVAVVLLIGCANVANLQIVRAAERSREISVRLAIGAGRAQIVRHLFTESLLVALAGGALGIGIAAWGIDGLIALKPSGIPRLAEIHIEATVLAFALGVSILSAIFFGLWPALRASKLDLNDALKQGGRANSASVAAVGLRSTLGVVQIALALVLLVGASLLLRSMSKVLSANLGFETGQALSAQFTLPAARYPAERIVPFHRELVQRLSDIPGVVSASMGQCLPLSDCYWTTGFTVEGAPPRPDQPQMNHYYVMPNFFSTLGIPLLEGRDFTERDLSLQVTIVSKRFAREYLPGPSALGRKIELGRSRQFYEVIGVVDDVRAASIENPGIPQTYFPASTPNATYVIRAQGDPAAFVRAVRDQILSMDPQLAVQKIQPIEANVREAVAARKFQTLLLTAFAAIAAILAVIGIYSVLAYAASQRTQEIGVRMALGADRTAVRGLFLRQALVLAAIGLAIGVAASLAATRALGSLLFGITATDPLTYGAVALLFLVVAMIASGIPAWRASRVDPMIALRHE